MKKETKLFNFIHEWEGTILLDGTGRSILSVLYQDVYIGFNRAIKFWPKHGLIYL